MILIICKRELVSFLKTTKMTNRNKIKPPKKLNPDDLFVKEMRTRIDSYFKIVVRTIKDTVPKILGHFLVKAS